MMMVGFIQRLLRVTEGAKFKKATAAAVVFIIIAALLAVLWPRALVLMLEDGNGGKYASFSIEEGQRFSVSFIHSVNQSPVCDIYEIRGGEIWVVETRYYNFGAGVQTEILPGQTLSYADDGAMVVSGIDEKRPELYYIVGTESDHLLLIGGEEISLGELCGRSGLVRFRIVEKLIC